MLPYRHKEVNHPMSAQQTILIVGAGLIGTSFALSVKDHNVAIHIVENHLPTITTTPSENTRPISLSYGSVQILKAIGVWDSLNDLACPILSVHVSEQGRFGSTRFKAKEENVPALGYVVPYNALQAALYHHAANQPNITISSIETIDAIHNHDDHITLMITQQNHNKSLQADLLVAADGTNSTCRDLLHIDYTEKNESDIARIFQLTLSEPHDHTAYERFTLNGVLAVLPLHDKNKAQLVWTITPHIAETINEWDDATILSFLQDAFENRIAIYHAKKITQFPLNTILAEKQIAPRAVLLGNAAHTIYPVAAQGFNLGLHDIGILSDVIADALHRQKPIGDEAILKKYETDITSHQKIILSITDQLTTLFSLPFIGSLRGLGLLSMDLLSPLKKNLAKRTMGITRLPNLLRRKR